MKSPVWYLPFLLIQGCVLPVDTRTIGALKPVQTVEVSPSDVEMGRARAAYLRTLMAGRSDEQTPESLRRLGDLGLEKLDQIAESATQVQRDGLLQQTLKYYDLALSLAKEPQQRERICYQQARALELSGDHAALVEVLRRFLQEYPASKHYDQVAFRLAELQYTNNEYSDAAVEYQNVAVLGETNRYYENAVYKRGWALFKQERFDAALDVFLSLLDRFDGDVNPYRQPEKHPILPDTLRAIDLSLERLALGETLSNWFRQHGSRDYEPDSYASLSRHLRDKGNYTDASGVLKGFVKEHPDHAQAPEFHQQIVDIYTEGGFPGQAIEARQQFVQAYRSDAVYWQSRRTESMPEVRQTLKRYLLELARYHHANASEQKAVDEWQAAADHYELILREFPDDSQATPLRFRLAEVHLALQAYEQAAITFARVAAESTDGELGATAAYAAVQAWDEARMRLDGNQDPRRLTDQLILAAQHMVHRFPRHPRSSDVYRYLGSILLSQSRPHDAEPLLFRALGFVSAKNSQEQAGLWLLLGDSRADQHRYVEARQAYRQAGIHSVNDTEMQQTVVARQVAALDAEATQARDQGRQDQAVSLYLELADLAPDSDQAPLALHDAATVRIRQARWEPAVTLLQRFLDHYPAHASAGDVQLKLALSFENSGQLQQAADLYVIQANAVSTMVGVQHLLRAASLYERAGYSTAAIGPLSQWLDDHKAAASEEVEVRFVLGKAAEKLGDLEMAVDQYNALLDGMAQSPREQTLFARAHLALGEIWERRYQQVFLLAPLKKTLAEKTHRMNLSLQHLSAAADSQVAEVTTAATFKMAALNADFAHALLGSERPPGMDPDEQEAFGLLLEEQAFPFEEQAINGHQRNIRRLAKGINDPWVSASLDQLKKLNPARFDKPMLAGSALHQLN